MSTVESSPNIDRELETAIANAISGVRDPEAMRKAAERMDRVREEIRRMHGILDIGVPAIRALRDGDGE